MKSRPVGETQKLVLQLLASSQRNRKSVRTLAFDWPGLSESQVRGALTRLESRGLVKRVGYHAGSYFYGLTEKGRELEAQLTGLGEDE